MKYLSKILSRKRITLFFLFQPFLKLFYRKRALEIISRRSKLSLSSKNVNFLTKDIPIIYYYAATPEIEKFNDFYGIASVLKQYANIPKDSYIRAHIEHAVSFSDSMFSGETFCSFPSIILCGEYRAKVLNSTGINKKIFKVGPYINYAKPILSKTQFEIEKKKLGKNILAFPQHSTPGIDVKYNVNKFCSKLRDVENKYGYEHTRICLYWKDIDLKKQYEREGFQVVTAGHMFDPLFLRRLRSLIELSDLTITNSVGSHLGYSISLGKPHLFLKQSIERFDKTNELYENFDKKFNDSTKELVEQFQKYTEKITADQIKIVNFYTGLDSIKTSKELRNILVGK